MKRSSTRLHIKWTCRVEAIIEMQVLICQNSKFMSKYRQKEDWSNHWKPTCIVKVPLTSVDQILSALFVPKANPMPSGRPKQWSYFHHDQKSFREKTLGEKSTANGWVCLSHTLILCKSVDRRAPFLQLQTLSQITFSFTNATSSTLLKLRMHQSRFCPCIQWEAKPPINQKRKQSIHHDWSGIRNIHFTFKKRHV